MAEELGLTVDEVEFEKAQAHSKKVSRGGSKKETANVVKLDVHDLAALEKNPDVPKTNDSAKFSEFCPRSANRSLMSGRPR